MSDPVQQARDELLAMLSHDLRGPLNAIAVALDGLRDPAVPAAAREKYVAAIERAVSKADRMLGDLITAGEIESGKLELQPAPLRVDELFEQVAREHGHAVGQARSKLVITVDPAIGSITGDRDRLAQALGQLVANSCRHARGTSTIELTARAGDGGRGVVLAVRDHGPGVAADVLPSLFDPAWPGRRRKGAVGLAIARGVARAHGGEADARLPDGGGLEVALQLP